MVIKSPWPFETHPLPNSLLKTEKNFEKERGTDGKLLSQNTSSKSLRASR